MEIIVRHKSDDRASEVVQHSIKNLADDETKLFGLNDSSNLNKLTVKISNKGENHFLDVVYKCREPPNYRFSCSKHRLLTSQFLCPCPCYIILVKAMNKPNFVPNILPVFEIEALSRSFMIQLFPKFLCVDENQIQIARNCRLKQLTNGSLFSTDPVQMFDKQ